MGKQFTEEERVAEKRKKGLTPNEEGDLPLNCIHLNTGFHFTNGARRVYLPAVLCLVYL